MSRWSDMQIVLTASGEACSGRALPTEEEEPASPAKRPRRDSREGDGESGNGGGAAAAKACGLAARKADWSKVLQRIHGVGQCAECGSLPYPHRCHVHRLPPEANEGDEETPWWYGANRAVSDLGLKRLTAKAERVHREELKASGSEWRTEWHGSKS